MSSNKSIHILSALNQCVVFYAFSAALALILGLATPDSEFFLRSAFIVIPVTASYLLYEYCESILVYLLVHIPIFAAPLIYLPGYAGYIHILSIVIIAVVHVHDCARQDTQPILDPELYDLAFFILPYLINAATLNLSAVSTVCLYGCAVSVVIICIYKYMRQLQLFIRSNETSTTIPVRQIIRTSRLPLCCFTAVTVILMICIPFSSISALSNLLKDGFVALLSLVFHFLGFGQSPGAGSATEIPADIAEETTQNAYEQIAKETASMPQWLNMTLYIIMLIFVVAVVIGILCVTVYLIYCFFKGFSHVSEKSEDYGYSERSESIREKKKLFSRKVREDTHDPNVVVRKLYRYTIVKHKSKEQGVLASQTPLEIEAFAGLPDNSDKATLHRCYEKARYSKTGVTGSEADAVTSAVRNLR